MMKLGNLNKRVEIKYEKQIKLLLVLCILRYWMVYLYDISDAISSLFWTRVVNTGLHILVVLPAFIVYKKWGLHKEQLDFKNVKQYIWALIMTLPFFAACQIVFGIKPTEGAKLLPGGLLWLFFYYFFIVAIGEEFFFRVYLLEELKVILGKAAWLAPVLSGVMFGMIHLPNNGWDSVIMNIMVGIALGYGKLYIKDCTFISLVISHGMYDFIITLI